MPVAIDPFRIPSAEELSNMLEAWDQAIGCAVCGQCDWGGEHINENEQVGDPTMWHDKQCLLYGRRDVAEFVFNLSIIEEELGRRCGL